MYVMYVMYVHFYLYARENYLSFSRTLYIFFSIRLSNFERT